MDSSRRSIWVTSENRSRGPLSSESKIDLFKGNLDKQSWTSNPRNNAIKITPSFCLWASRMIEETERSEVSKVSVEVPANRDALKEEQWIRSATLQWKSLISVSTQFFNPWRTARRRREALCEVITEQMDIPAEARLLICWRNVESSVWGLCNSCSISGSDMIWAVPSGKDLGVCGAYRSMSEGRW